MQDVAALGRFPGIKASALSTEQRATLERLIADRGSVPGPYRFLINSPLVVEHIGGLGTDLRAKGNMSKQEREIVTLVTVRHYRNEYLQASHRETSVNAGIPADVIDSILGDREPPIADTRQLALYELATALHNSIRLTKQQADAAEKSLGLATVSEVIGLIAVYTASTFTMRFVNATAPKADT